MNLWPLADPRLLKPDDLVAEHAECHRLYREWNHKRLDLSGSEVSFVIMRHELIRIAANKRTGLRHALETTAGQRAHPSPIAPTWLMHSYLTHRYLRVLMIYERWVYVRRRTDVELINLLFLALMKRAAVPIPPTVQQTPWGDRTPMEYQTREEVPA